MRSMYEMAALMLLACGFAGCTIQREPAQSPFASDAVVIAPGIAPRSVHVPLVLIRP